MKLITLMFLLFSFPVIVGSSGNKVVIFKDVKIDIKEGVELTIESLHEYILELEIKHAEIVIKQVILECGLDANNLLVRENNNILGLKQPKIRKTTAFGTKHGHACYDGLKECLEDYKMWQEYWEGFHEIPTNDYYSWLVKIGYATDKNYVRKLKSINACNYE